MTAADATPNWAPSRPERWVHAQRGPASAVTNGDGRPSSSLSGDAQAALLAPLAWQRIQRELHVYVAALVQTFQDREVVLWNPGPILAWSESQAVDRALKLLLQHPEPVHVFPGSKPRLTVQRVNASE